MEIIYLKMFLFILSLNIFLPLILKMFGLKVDMTKAFCGLVGYCGSKPADPGIIKMIMIYNEERGSDSTGWAVNNIVEKDTDKVKKFLQNHTLDIAEDNINFTIIAHARNGSSGSKMNKELAHPFSIYKGGVEKDIPDLILAMNGTLNNTELMAKTFEIEFKQYSNSDTQVIAKAMAELGEKDYIKVIESYSGTATLLFFTPKRPNTLMVYKDPERPLFYWQKSEGEIYISSMEEPLFTVGALKEDVIPFENESITTISKGKITKTIKVKREPLKAKTKYGTNGGNPREMYYHGFDNTEDFHYDGNTNCGFPLNSINNKAHVGRSPVVSLKNTGEIHNPKNPHAGKGNLVYCLIDRFYRNGHTIHGKFYIGPSGKVYDICQHEVKEYWFVNGYMCKNETEYDKLVSTCVDEKKNFAIRKFKSKLLSSMVEHLQYPIVTNVDGVDKWILNKEWAKKFEHKGQALEIDILWSPMTIVLQYNNEYTSATFKDVATVIKYKEKQSAQLSISVENGTIKPPLTALVDEICSRVDVPSQVRYLRNIIKNDKRFAFRSNYFYTTMLIDVYKVNRQVDLKEFFYKTLLCDLKSANLIDSVKFADLQTRGVKDNFSSQEVIAEIDTYLEPFHKYLNRIEKNDSEGGAITTSNFQELDDDLTTQEKIKIAQDDNNNITDSEIINSIRKKNLYFNTEKFQNEVCDAEPSFDKFLTEWTKNDNQKEVSIFLEGILLCFNKIGYIDESDLLNRLDNNYVAIKLSTRKAWEDWQKNYSQLSKKVIEEANIIIKSYENDEEPITEELTPTVMEDILGSQLLEVMNGMQDYVNEVEKLDSDKRTEWVEDSKVQMNSAIRYLTKRLLTENKDK